MVCSRWRAGTMTEATLGERTARIGVMRFELGPSDSERELLGGLGDALVRSGLVAETVDLVPTDAGLVLIAECVLRDASELMHALRELVVTDWTVLRPCSLAS
jgi:hypothetical protein